MSRDPRANTNKLLAALDEGSVDREYLITAALNWLSDADVHQMCLANDILLEDDDEV